MDPFESGEFAGSDRFKILRRLGAGGMGVVYEARDLKRDLVVALKTVRQFDPSALYRFKKEFRALEDVVHPNLVRLWELFFDGKTCFFTMELVQGTDFLRYVRPSRLDDAETRSATAAHVASTLGADAPPGTDRAGDVPETEAATGSVRRADGDGPEPTDGRVGETTRRGGPGATTVEGPPRSTSAGTGAGVGAQAATDGFVIGPPALDVPRLRSALRQLAAALAALHAVGKLHRDIKPSNVMVEWGGRVVLLDFGVTTELLAEGDPDATDKAVVGTFAYMAPEQAAGRPLTGSSDWYSVGVVLYLALTGRLPFDGTRHEIVTRKQTDDPPHPSDPAGGLPDDLVALCLELLRRDPEGRPTGDEVLRRLGREGGGANAFWGASAAHQGRPFIGREPHLAALAEAFESTRSGRTVAAFIHGRSGAGKSALVHRFLEGVAGRGDVVVLGGRCYEQESVAFKALDALIDALSHYLRRLSRLEADAILPRDIATLARVFPVLRRVEAVAGAPQRVLESPDQQELRRRAFAALREMLARIGDRAALVLHIDDLQWGDVDSADLLSDLLRPPDAPVLLLLCCYRSEHAQSSPCLLRLLTPGEDGAPGPDRREVAVDALTPDEARSLSRLLLAGYGGVTETLAEVVAKESGCSPYFVYELAHYLTGGGEITDSLEGVGQVSLDEVLWRRVRALPPEPRRLLEAIAVAGRPVGQATVCRAAGLGSDGFAALAFLRANNLVRGQGQGILDEVESYHDRIRETVRRRLSPAGRMDWHRLLARELEESEGADPETLGVHFEAAGEPARAGEYYARAAAAAVESLAFDRAAKLYRRVLELRPGDDPDAPALRVRLAEALANAGRGWESAGAYLQAAAGASGAAAYDLRAKAAYQFLISGHIDEGLAAFREVLARVGLRRPSSPNQALFWLLKQRLFLAVFGLRFRERAADQVPPGDLARADVSRAVAVGISVVDVIQGSYFQSRSLRFALKAGEPYRVALALGWEAVHSACQGRSARRRTARLIALAGGVADRVGHPHAVGMATLSAGAADYMAGRFASAAVLTDRAAALFRGECTGVVWELDTSLVFGLWARIYQGEIAELSRRFQAFDKEARDRGDRYMQSTLGTYPGVLARLADDAPAEARALGDEAIGQWSQHGFHVQHLTHYFGNTYIDLYEGDGAAAWRRAERSWPEIRASLLPRIQHVTVDVLQLRARSALAAAAGSPSPGALLAAAVHFARRLDRQKMAWGQAVATLVRAGAASVRGDDAGSVRLLSLAVERFDAERLGLFAAAARRRLGERLGGDEGRALVARADAWMTAQAIRSPARMAACLAPGFPDPSGPPPTRRPGRDHSS